MLRLSMSSMFWSRCMWESEENTLRDLTREICLSQDLGGPRELAGTEVTASFLTGSVIRDLITLGTVTGTGTMTEGLTGSDIIDTGAGDMRGTGSETVISWFCWRWEGAV